MRVILFAAAAIVAAIAPACGGTAGPPSRGVIEADLSGWSFRRYQALLDVEIEVAANRAIAHSASYARKSAERRGRLADGDVVNAVVTRYRRADGVARSLIAFARRLAESASYRVEEQERSGVRLIDIAGGAERWVMWPARGHVVKLGGPGVSAVPGDLIAAYAERYPSSLPAGALDAPLEPAPAPPRGPR